MTFYFTVDFMTDYQNKPIVATYNKTIIYIYEKIFHEKVNEKALKFINSLSYLALGTLIASIFSFTYNILAVRFLGPYEYGKYTLISTIAMFLYIPMLLGISTAIVKYNSEKIDFDRQKVIVSTSYILVFIFTFITLIFYYVFSSIIIKTFSIPQDLYWLSVMFAFFFVYYTLTTETIRSLFKMRMLAILNSIQAILLFTSFLLYIVLNNSSFKAIVYSTYIAYIVISVINFLYIYKYLKPVFDREWARKLMKYSSFTIFSGISYMLYTNIDKILINKYMTVMDVGIYNAYTYASMTILDLLSGIFITVFFPTVSGYKNKKIILKKINKFAPYLFLLGMPVTIIAEFLILNLYGGEYPIDLLWILTFALISVLSTLYRVYAWLFNSEGERGIKLTLSGTGTIAIVNILLDIYLIPQLGILGALIATALAFCVGICVIHICKGTVFDCLSN
jgi:O-antigen/teichoic acid export membrane protein